MNVIPSGQLTSLNVSGTYTIVCSLGEEPVKLSIEVPRQRFWLHYFHVFAGNH